MQWSKSPLNATQSAIEPAQAPPIQEEPEQSAEATAEEPEQTAEATAEEPEQSAEATAEDPDQPVDQPNLEGHQEERGDAPVVPPDQPDLEEVKKESDSVKQEDDQPDDDLTAADLLSQVATAGSVGGDGEPLALLQPTQGRRNRPCKIRYRKPGVRFLHRHFQISMY